MNRNIIKALYRLHLLEKLIVTGHNHGTTVPIIQGVGYGNMFGSEPWMKELLTKLLPDFPGTFIDVGANVGQTLIKVREVSQVDYIGFEPNPICNSYLAELIKRNGYTNCRIIPVGLADKTQLFPLQFYVDTSTDSGASIIPGFRSQRTPKRIEYVPCFVWDDLNLDTGQIGIVKIDVEGAELEVIEGMSAIIKKDRPAILMEILPDATLPEKVRRQRLIEKFFLDINYECLLIVKDEAKFISLAPVVEINNYDDENAADYVFLPKK